MNKFLTLIILGVSTLAVRAQTDKPQTLSVKESQAYGTVDVADLELKNCDFEKDANAMVLFDVGNVYFEQDASRTELMVEERHTRIKIFNDKGKDRSNFKIIYYGGAEHITDLDAETVNYNNGKIQITKLDKKLIYKTAIDNQFYSITFSMPDVKPSSVIEYRYKYSSSFAFPNWFFQNTIPVRYSEINTTVPNIITFNEQIHTQQPFFKHIRTNGYINMGNRNLDAQIEKTAMANIPSLNDEPGMTSYTDNLESIRYVSFGAFKNTWERSLEILNDSENFGRQLSKTIDDEGDIVKKAKALNSNNEKVSYLFNTVRDMMKWNDYDSYYTNIGINKAWESKSGNSTEINIILCHLLNQSGVKAYPMLVSTRKNGKVNPAYAFLGQFNKTVVYVPMGADTANYCVLDATGKYNSYNEIPYNLLNSSGIYVDLQNKTTGIIFLENTLPIRKVVLINAEIAADGKMTGTADISDYGYNRVKSLRIYKNEGEEKYIDYLRNKDNTISISSLKLENMEDDTLPLTQNFNFKADLPGSDQNYIYLNTNLFTTLQTNPFLSDTRSTDIDFGYRDNYSISGVYKIPAGYKVESLPKNINTITPDNSIGFKRIVIEEDGTITIRYVIDHKKTIFFREQYADFHEFYKKMFEMLNEQIVLKKA